jgi:hypothetical protein
MKDDPMLVDNNNDAIDIATKTYFAVFILGS